MKVRGLHEERWFVMKNHLYSFDSKANLTYEKNHMLALIIHPLASFVVTTMPFNKRAVFVICYVGR